MLKSKLALVTGSTKGIGLGIAEALIEQGYGIIFNGRNKESLNMVAKKFPSHYYFHGDLGMTSDAKKLFDFVSHLNKEIHVLVCNIGDGASVPPGEESYEEWIRVFHSNFFSATNTIEALKDKIIKDMTSIIFISSICGLEIIEGAPLTYTVAKSALNAYAQGLAKAWGKYGVRVNTVAPGNILFKGSIWEKKLVANKDQVHQMLQLKVPLKSLGTLDDVASAILFLSSSKASFVTGALIKIDGGQTSYL